MLLLFQIFIAVSLFSIVYVESDRSKILADVYNENEMKFNEFNLNDVQYHRKYLLSCSRSRSTNNSELLESVTIIVNHVEKKMGFLNPNSQT